MKKSLPLLLVSMMVLIILPGCGGGGGGSGSPGSSGFEDVGASITITSSSHSDPAGSDSWQIDLTQNNCDGEPEDWGDDFAVLGFAAESYDENFPSGTLFITSYTVEYTPQLFELSLPPVNKYDLTTSVAISPDGSAEATFLILDAGAKIEYMEDLNSGLYDSLGEDPYLYDLKITFFGDDEFGEDFDFSFNTTIEFGHYNKC